MTDFMDISNPISPLNPFNPLNASSPLSPLNPLNPLSPLHTSSPNRSHEVQPERCSDHACVTTHGTAPSVVGWLVLVLLILVPIFWRSPRR